MYEIKPTLPFQRNFKKLAKKYRQIKKDLEIILNDLEKGIFVGDELQGFSGNVFKARVASIDQKKGKSGGFRLIYLVRIQNKRIYLANIYAKSQQSDLTHTQKQKIEDLVVLLDRQSLDNLNDTNI